MPNWGVAIVVTCAVLIAVVGVGVSLRIDTAARAGDTAPVISTSSPLPRVAPTTDTVETAPVPVKQRAAVFLWTVRNEYPELAGVADDTLTGLAESACKVLESGGTKTDVFLALLDNSDPENAEALAYTVGAGVAVFCPKYAGVFA